MPLRPSHRTLLLFTLLGLVAGIFAACQSNNPPPKKVLKNRWRFESEGLFGYIDATGKVAIEPNFRYSGPFVSGFAPAMKEGYFGFIDSTGAFREDPEYDYCAVYSHGIAEVWKDGKNWFVDLNGDEVIPWFSHAKTEQLESGMVKVVTRSDRVGLLNTRGEWVLDTIWSEIQPFSGGLATIRDQKGACQVVDTSGKTVIPSGKFSMIFQFSGGMARAYQMDEANEPEEVVIDKKGGIVLSMKDHEWEFASTTPHFEDEWVSVIFPERIRKTVRSDPPCGFFNLSSHELLMDSTWYKTSRFHQNRFIMLSEQGLAFMVDEKGKKICEEKNIRFLSPGRKLEDYRPFMNGPEPVVIDYFHFGFLNHQGDFEPFGEGKTWGDSADFSFPAYHKKPISEIFALIGNPETKVNEEGDTTYVQRLGWINLKTQKITLPRVEKIFVLDTTQKWMAVTVNDSTGWMDWEGNWIISNPGNLNPWGNPYLQKDQPFFKLFQESSSITFPYNMLRLRNGTRWYQEGQHNPENVQGLQKIQSPEQFPAGPSIFPGQTGNDTLDSFEASFFFSIVNNGRDTMFIPAVEESPFLIYEARDEKGNWRPLETLPNSFSSERKRTYYLPPNWSLDLMGVKFEGAIETELRLRLEYKTTPNQQENEVLYSPSFKGKINPGQFSVPHQELWFPEYAQPDFFF